MNTIESIVFNVDLYEPADWWALLLYHMEGAHIAIPLPNADLMSFIRVFNNTTQCKEHIVEHNNREITLYTYEDNMGWLIKNSYLNNLPRPAKISIFCSTDDDIKYWRTMTRRFRARVEEPFLYRELNYRLIYFGIDYIRKLRGQFPGDDNVQNLLTVTYHGLCEALCEQI